MKTLSCHEFGLFKVRYISACSMGTVRCSHLLWHIRSIGGKFWFLGDLADYFFT